MPLHLSAPTIPLPGRLTTVLSFGGLCAVGAGLCDVALIALFVQLPREQVGSNVAQTLRSFAARPYQRPDIYLLLGLGSLAALGTVRAFAELVRGPHRADVQWSCNLAYLGLGLSVSALRSFREFAMMPKAPPPTPFFAKVIESCVRWIVLVALVADAIRVWNHICVLQHFAGVWSKCQSVVSEPCGSRPDPPGLVLGNGMDCAAS